jgi:hypothetical protein
MRLQRTARYVANDGLVVDDENCGPAIRLSHGTLPGGWCGPL